MTFEELHGAPNQPPRAQRRGRPGRVHREDHAQEVHEPLVLLERVHRPRGQRMQRARAEILNREARVAARRANSACRPN